MHKSDGKSLEEILKSLPKKIEISDEKSIFNKKMSSILKWIFIQSKFFLSLFEIFPKLGLKNSFFIFTSSF